MNRFVYLLSMLWIVATGEFLIGVAKGEREPEMFALSFFIAITCALLWEKEE